MSDVNPVTTEIIRNALISAAREMNASLFRSAYSPIIYEMKDCSVGIFDADANLLGQAAGLPIFLGNLEETIRVTTEVFGRDSYREGDVYVLNDSYLTGTHLNDMTVFSPIFYEGGLVGFAATRAHWLDIGSKDPGYPMDSTEIYQEGIRIRPTKLVDAGTLRADVQELICRNSRLYSSAVGDLNAQIAACRTGEKRYREIIRKFGLETVRAASRDIFAQSERMDREAVSRIPDGEYFAEGYLDDDGVGSDPIAVKVKVTIDGDEMEIDLDGSSPQTTGPTNCGLAQTISACRVAFKQLVHPDSPVTGGNFRNLRVKAPEGSIFTAKEPAACGWYFSSLGLLIDLVVKAIAPACPGQAAAAHYGDSMVITFAGVDDAAGAPFLSVEATVGGWGAHAGGDGQDCLINAVNGDFKNMPVEVLETKYPLTVTTYGIRPDSAGPGRYRGGMGAVREYRLNCSSGNLYLWFERSVTPAWGLNGGGPGRGPAVVVGPGTDEERTLLKCNAVPLEKGTVVRALTGGGGGYGDPMERDVGAVVADVVGGYITPRHAREVYGVVMDKAGLKVDEDATRRLRSRR